MGCIDGAWGTWEARAALQGFAPGSGFPSFRAQRGFVAPQGFSWGGGVGFSVSLQGFGAPGLRGVGFEGSGTVSPSSESEEQSTPAPISEPQTRNPATLNPAYPPNQGSSDLTLGPNLTSQILTPELPSLPKAVRTSPQP